MCTNSNCDKTIKKTQTVTKLNNSNYDKFGLNLKTQIATKFNSNCDKTQKLKWGQNSKLILWQNSKTWKAIKLKTQLLINSKTQRVTGPVLTSDRERKNTVSYLLVKLQIYTLHKLSEVFWKFAHPEGVEWSLVCFA